jgi:hypothetical protein
MNALLTYIHTYMHTYMSCCDNQAAQMRLVWQLRWRTMLHTRYDAWYAVVPAEPGPDCSTLLELCISQSQQADAGQATTCTHA